MAERIVDGAEIIEIHLERSQLLGRAQEPQHTNQIPFPDTGGSGKSPTTAGSIPSGRAMGTSYSSRHWTIASWWQPARRRAIRLYRTNRDCGPRSAWRQGTQIQIMISR